MLKPLQIPTAEVFLPLLKPARYKGAHGGRGSAKSHFFAEMMVDDHIRIPALRSVCIRENQKSLKESAKRLIEDKIQALGVGDQFTCKHDCIETPHGGIIIFQGMNGQTEQSITSLEGYKRAWVEEAQTLSARSLELLRPTIRGDDSEMWFSWNPRRKSDPVDQLLRVSPPPRTAVVESNYKNNPWFPAVLKEELEYDRINNPDTFAHIWGGEYATVVKGAYYAESITTARQEGRIGFVPADPLMSYRAYWDIGGTGQKADRVAIWIVQFIDLEIRLLNYYEAQGQPLATHVNWLREHAYDKAECVLPHDGVQHEKTIDVTYESALKTAGFSARTVKNQGTGAARQRIEAGRRLFPSMRFNEETTIGGIEALGSYHEKMDTHRNIGLGPEHDWASDGSDAFGLMAIDFKPPKEYRKPDYSNRDRRVI